MDLSDATIAVIGLGYVGLPLAVEFGKVRPVLGFDVREERVAELRAGIDRTREVEASVLAAACHLKYTAALDDLRACDVFIVAVPTPIDLAKRPDIGLLKRASETVGRAIRPGGVVIFESTVYPGCTRNECVPIIEQHSGLVFNRDFFVGYSPERINPGDKQHRLTTITKVTSGSTPEAAEAIDRLYGQIIAAGTHKAIALMNELAIIFHKLGLDTNEVLAAAGSKWNFLPFKPGLVGGHCIGVDPYYLTYRAQEAGYHPEVILAGRRINDAMGEHVADRVARLMMKRGFPVVGSRILVLGLTFKENCPDLRNSKVVDLISALKECNARVDVFDPWVDPAEARHEYAIDLIEKWPEPGSYDAIILAVAHREYAELGAEAIRALGKPGSVVFDIKGVLAKKESDGRL